MTYADQQLFLETLEEWQIVCADGLSFLEAGDFNSAWKLVGRAKELEVIVQSLQEIRTFLCRPGLARMPLTPRRCDRKPVASDTVMPNHLTILPQSS